MRVVKHWNGLPREVGGPVPGNIQGQVGPGSEQPSPVEDVPAHCRGLGLDGQPKAFYESNRVPHEVASLGPCYCP